MSGVCIESLDEVKSLAWLLGVERVLQEIVGKSLKDLLSQPCRNMVCCMQYNLQDFSSALVEFNSSVRRYVECAKQ